MDPNENWLSIRVLYGQYKPSFFWWELVIVCEKIFLTSAMVVVLPGTLMQVVVALSSKLCVSLVQTVAAPYVLHSDHVFASAVNASMIALFISLLLLKLGLLVDQ